MSESAMIKGISMVSVYAVDFEASMTFYRDILGLQDWQPMGEQAAYFRFGVASDGNPFGMYLIGGRKPLPADLERPARTTFSFDVPSVSALAAHLRSNNVRLAFEEPMDMGQGYFWLQAFDPSNNVIEFLGQQ